MCCSFQSKNLQVEHQFICVHTYRFILQVGSGVATSPSTAPTPTLHAVAPSPSPVVPVPHTTPVEPLTTKTKGGDNHTCENDRTKKPACVDVEPSISPEEQSRLSQTSGPPRRGRPPKAKGKAKAKSAKSKSSSIPKNPQEGERRSKATSSQDTPPSTETNKRKKSPPSTEPSEHKKSKKVKITRKSQSKHQEAN